MHSHTIDKQRRAGGGLPVAAYRCLDKETARYIAGRGCAESKVEVSGGVGVRVLARWYPMMEVTCLRHRRSSIYSMAVGWSVASASSRAVADAGDA